MHVTIITPENTVYDGEANALSVPGVNGEFQMLENHATIISILLEGNIKIKGHSEISEHFASLFTQLKDGGVSLSIKGGTLEFKNNRAVILAD